MDQVDTACSEGEGVRVGMGEDTTAHGNGEEAGVEKEISCTEEDSVAASLAAALTRNSLPATSYHGSGSTRQVGLETPLSIVVDRFPMLLLLLNIQPMFTDYVVDGTQEHEVDGSC